MDSGSSRWVLIIICGTAESENPSRDSNEKDAVNVSDIGQGKMR